MTELNLIARIDEDTQTDTNALEQNLIFQQVVKMDPKFATRLKTAWQGDVKALKTGIKHFLFPACLEKANFDKFANDTLKARFDLVAPKLIALFNKCVNAEKDIWHDRGDVWSDVKYARKEDPRSTSFVKEDYEQIKTELSL